jgi:hypothetical protein
MSGLGAYESGTCSQSGASNLVNSRRRWWFLAMRLRGGIRFAIKGDPASSSGFELRFKVESRGFGHLDEGCLRLGLFA